MKTPRVAAGARSVRDCWSLSTGIANRGEKRAAKLENQRSERQVCTTARTYHNPE